MKTLLRSSFTTEPLPSCREQTTTIKLNKAGCDWPQADEVTQVLDVHLVVKVKFPPSVCDLFLRRFLRDNRETTRCTSTENIFFMTLFSSSHKNMKDKTKDESVLDFKCADRSAFSVFSEPECESLIKSVPHK